MTTHTFGVILSIGMILLIALVFGIILTRIIFGKNSTIIQKVVRYSLPIGFMVSFAGLAGSLTYSEIFGLTPCMFCWWQRIFIYPQAVLFAIAWYQSSKNTHSINIFQYTTPIAVVGSLVSLYHVLLQRGIIGLDGASSCILSGTPCNIISTQIFGFITIPVMALSIGITLSVLGYLVLSNKKTA